MITTPIKTTRVTAGSADLLAVLDASLPKLHEDCVIAITSKIVAICEGSVVDADTISKNELIKQQSNKYLAAEYSMYGHHFTITDNTLIASAGIDESNGEGYYILWPRDPWATAENVRQHLTDKYGVRRIGVIITDSTCQPLRRGTAGISLAHSGFKGLRNYMGKPDLFGRPMQVTQANVSGGIAAAAVLAMGEGAEQTPVCILRDIPGLEYTAAAPSEAELREIRIDMQDDLFAPFLTAVPWQIGGRSDAD